LLKAKPDGCRTAPYPRQHNPAEIRGHGRLTRVTEPALDDEQQETPSRDISTRLPVAKPEPVT
jgi:hypothetical protein